jgi:hypothetical protein
VRDLWREIFGEKSLVSQRSLVRDLWQEIFGERSLVSLLGELFGVPPTLGETLFGKKSLVTSLRFISKYNS